MRPDSSVRGPHESPDPALHVVVTGHGPGVVCTHGLADDSRTFDHQVRHLASTHRVAVWDLPGHGASPPSRTAANRATALAGIDRAADATGGGPAVLVGHSLGGYLSLCWALLRPAQAAALVLISTGPGFRDPAKRAAWNEGIATYAAERGVPPHAAGLGRQDDSLVLDGLSSLTMPVLLVVGSRDRSYHRGKRLLERSLANASLLVVDGAGHFPHRTHASVVNAAIDRFLGQIADAPP